jgi:hypothetical protein
VQVGRIAGDVRVVHAGGDGDERDGLAEVVFVDDLVPEQPPEHVDLRVQVPPQEHAGTELAKFMPDDRSTPSCRLTLSTGGASFCPRILAAKRTAKRDENLFPSVVRNHL